MHETLGRRVAGISGIFGGLRTATGDDFAWRALFIGGLLGGAALDNALNPRAELPTLPALGVPRYVLAGLLVGAGTKLGNGCTSGHGVCGLARGSQRSLAAVLVFMFTGFASSTVLHLLQPSGAVALPAFTLPPLRMAPAAGHLPSLALAAYTALLMLTAMRAHTTLNTLLCGVTFGLGLGISGMTYPQKVTSFLDATGLGGVAWDPSLAFVMGGGLLGSALGCVRWLRTRVVLSADCICATLRVRSYQASRRLAAPVLAPKFALPTRSDIDARLLGGAALFGTGWSLAGGSCHPHVSGPCAQAGPTSRRHVSRPCAREPVAAALWRRRLPDGRRLLRRHGGRHGRRGRAHSGAIAQKEAVKHRRALKLALLPLVRRVLASSARRGRAQPCGAAQTRAWVVLFG